MSTPLSLKCPIGPIFGVPPLFPALHNLLGHGVHQSFTGCHWSPLHSSMTTSWSWWMLETLRSSTFHLRMPHRCSIGLKSWDMLGQSITFTSAFFSKGSGCLRCVFGAMEYCPAAQSRREGIMLCFSTSQYMSASLMQTPRPWHSTTILNCRQDTLVFELLPGCRPHMLWYHL